MADPTERLFDGLDAPRPLPPELRERLAEQLLSGAEATETAPLPLGAELDERLRAALTDPVAELFDGLDQPRALPEAMRARLADALAAGAPQRPRRRGGWPAGLVGAAAAAVVIVAVMVLSLSSGGRHGNESGSSAVNAPSTAATQPQGLAGGETGVATGGGADQQGTAPTSRSSGGPASVTGGVAGTGNSTDTARGAGITAAEPSAGPLAGGTTVTIHGSGFATATGVSFGPRAATAFTVVSDSAIRARTPASAHPTAVDIVVSLRSGASYRLSSAFTYLPRPRVDGVSPSSGTINGGTWVTVSGAALRRTTQVHFGGSEAQRIEVVSDTRLRVLSPQHLPGSVDITVTTPGGSSPAGSGDRYTYLP